MAFLFEGVMILAQEKWLENGKNQLNEYIRNTAYKTNNNYGAAFPAIRLPKFNPMPLPNNQGIYYTPPIQPSQMTPINQALNETFQPQYIQTADYNGQPIRVPPSNFLNDTADWLKERAMDYAPTIGGLVGSGISGVGLARYGMAQPRISNFLATVAAMRYGKPLVDGLYKIIYNPVTDKIENGVGKFVDLTGIGGF